MIVDTEKVLREADGSVKLVEIRPHTDGKVFAPGCASKPDCESREEPEEHKRYTCEGCLMVGSDHGPQAEVAQGVGPGPLVEL